MRHSSPSAAFPSPSSGVLYSPHTEKQCLSLQWTPTSRPLQVEVHQLLHQLKLLAAQQPGATIMPC